MTSSNSRDLGRSRKRRSLEEQVAEREERFHRAHAVAAEAVTIPPSNREAFVAGHPDCLCSEFVELMIGLAREFRTESPRDSVRCAHLAVTAVEATFGMSLDGEEDLRALAWAELGNGHRILGDFRSAGIAFHHANQRVRDTADPLVRSEVYSLEASYWTYRQDHERSERLLRRAEKLQDRYGTAHATGRLQIKRAEPLRCLGRLKEAIDLIESGLRLVDPRLEPSLALTGVHNLSYCLIQAGAHKAAMRILRRYEPVYEAFAHPSFATRRTWLEAEALASAGCPELAEPVYEKARQAFLSLDCPYEVGLISLDLTILFANAARWDDAERTAAETLAICQAHGVEAEGLAAAQILLEAARRRQVSSAKIATLVSAVRQHLTPRVSVS